MALIKTPPSVKAPVIALENIIVKTSVDTSGFATITQAPRDTIKETIANKASSIGHRYFRLIILD
jgi:hypothetical protein